MRAETLEAYEVWYATPSEVPARSTLYCLEPISMGGTEVEGLTSYMMRLAETHQVSVYVLANLISDHLSHPFQYQSPAIRGKKMCLRWRDMDNIVATLEEWVTAIEKLTLRSDLRMLTMLKWASLIDLRDVYSPLRTWCPCCYEERQRTEQALYEPLLWNIRGMTLCLKHLCPLRHRCKRCQEFGTLMFKTARLGYCSKCGGWLGEEPSASRRATLPEHKRQKWMALNIAELISTMSETSGPITVKELIAKLRRIEKREGVKPFLKLPVDEVREVFQEKRLPSLTFLLNVCYEKGMSLSSLLAMP